MSLAAAGVIYCVTKDRSYLSEALASARSLQTHCRDLPIALFTDFDLSDYERSLFDHVFLAPPHRDDRPFIARLQAFQQSPFERTLALDADTLIRADVTAAGAFALLDRFDIAAAPVPYSRRQDSRYRVGDVPDAFTEFNCGVLLFARNDGVAAFLRRWSDLYAADHLDRGMRGNDQVYFRLALYESDLRVATLPPTFNCRYHQSSGVFDDVVAHWLRIDAAQPSVIVHDRRIAAYLRAVDVLGHEVALQRVQKLHPKKAHYW